MARCSSGRHIANCQFDSPLSCSAPMANPPGAGAVAPFPLTTPPQKVFVQIWKLSGFFTLICGTVDHGPFFMPRSSIPMRARENEGHFG